jgi:hypothetical protein
MSYFPRPVSAAIVDEEIFPVSVRLGQNALDALGEIFLGIEERGDNRDKGLISHSQHLSR